MNKIQPIFLISLPRSGSTLLQKILMSHSDIASHAEPWFMLPLIYGMKTKGIKTEYGQESATIAIDSIKKSLGDDGFYKREVITFALNLYKKLSDGERYFLDKTPRYFYILDELIELFPYAKFIILLRNPISIFASNIEAFKNNSIKRLDQLDGDFYIGPKKIANFLDKYANNENVLTLCYDDLTCNPENTIQNICDFLEIEYGSSMLEKFTSQRLEGFGDHLGAKKYTSIKNNQDKWKSIVDTPVRKRLLKEYILNYDSEYLKYAKLERGELLQKIRKHRVKFNTKELFLLIQLKVIRILKRMIKYKSMY